MKTNHSQSAGFRRFILVIFAALLVPGSVYYYARYIEPNLLRLENVPVRSSSVTADLQGIRVIQISDLHLGEFYSPDKLRRLADRINRLKPDLVVFTGDLIDNFSQYRGDPAEIGQILNHIRAPLGKFAIYGNHDQGGGGKNHYIKLMNSGGFKVFVNAHQVLHIGNSQLAIAGLDDFLLGSPDLKKTFRGIPPSAFVLLLVHEPDVADRLAAYPVDLQLSGHSHGGQVQLPGLGSLYTPPLARKYTEGLYNFENGGEKPFKLYVNRGIGTTRLPFRFLSVPEVTLLTLEHI